MRRAKGSHHIVVRGVEYRWRARGDDACIGIGIWPTNDIGPYMSGNLRYHETWIDNGDGSYSSAKDQLVVTARIVRRVIEYAIDRHGYDPEATGKELALRSLDDAIRWDDAIRPETNP